MFHVIGILFHICYKFLDHVLHSCEIMTFGGCSLIMHFSINGICRDNCSKVYLGVIQNLALGHFQGKDNEFSVKHATSNILVLK